MTSLLLFLLVQLKQLEDLLEVGQGQGVDAMTNRGRT